MKLRCEITNRKWYTKEFKLCDPLGERARNLGINANMLGYPVGGYQVRGLMWELGSGCAIGGVTNDGQRSCPSGVSEPVDAGFCGDCAELGMGLGCHLCLGPRGLTVSGRCGRPVCPQGGSWPMGSRLTANLARDDSVWCCDVAERSAGR